MKRIVTGVILQEHPVDWMVDEQTNKSAIAIKIVSKTKTVEGLKFHALLFAHKSTVRWMVSSIDVKIHVNEEQDYVDMYTVYFESFL